MSPSPPAFGPKQAFAVLGLYLGSQIAVAAVVAGVGVFVLAFRSAAAGRPFDPLRPPNGILMAALILSVVVSAGGAIGMSLIWRRGRLHSPEPAGFGLLRPSARSILVGIVAGLLLALAFRFLVPRIVPFDPHMKLGPVTTAALETPATRALWVVLAILVAPPIEEYLFRGVLLAGLRARFSALGSAAAVTALFVACHVTEAIAYWPAFLALAGFGALTAALRVRSGSIVPGLVAHVAYNVVVAGAAVGF